MAEENNALTGEEVVWVSELEAAAKEAGLQAPNKFWLAATALVSKGDVKRGLKRLKNWSKVEEKYRVSEVNVDELTPWVKATFPDVLLTMGKNKNGCMAYGFRTSAFEPSRILSDKELRYWMKGTLMTFFACCPTISAVRRGMAAAHSCKDMHMSNFSLSYEQKMAGLYQDALPIKIKQILIIDPPSFFGYLKKLVSFFMSKKLMDRVFLVSQDELAEHFPTSSIAVEFGGTQTQDFFTFRDDGYKRYLQSVEELERTL